MCTRRAIWRNSDRNSISLLLLTPPTPTQAPTALTKPRSKRPLSLIADAAAKFTLPKEAEIAIGAAGIFLSYSVLAVQQENVYAAQFCAILNAIQFSKDSLSHL